MWLFVIRTILQFIGLYVIVWLCIIAGEEYMKIRRREKHEQG